MSGRTWQQDPRRREAIEVATLDTLYVHGVVGTTYRKVAQAADVPLSAVSYYFPTLQILLAAAFKRLAQEVSRSFSAEMEQATCKDEACDAVVRIIFGDSTASRRVLLLCYELYAYASRNPDMREVVRDWMLCSRATLGKHFSPLACAALDALLDGAMTHRTFLPATPEDMRKVVGCLATL